MRKQKLRRLVTIFFFCQGMRVVNIVGFRRGYKFLNELLGLAKPFGEVVKHLVLDLRPEVGGPSPVGRVRRQKRRQC